ncbi:MAG: hypothetical protein ABIG93_05580 [archaeon]|nr:hypothetical protein [Nanoarchaeota archaeon]
MSRNLEILDQFFKDMQKILYMKAQPKSKAKMLYGARYWAEYVMLINNRFIQDHLEEKSS